MISFACQRIDIKDIIRCSFDLSRTEYVLLVHLLGEEEPVTISAIANKKGLERSTVQKAISNLYEKGIVERRQLNLSSGGYRYIYAVKEKELLKERLSKVMDEWFRNVREAVDKW